MALVRHAGCRELIWQKAGGDGAHGAGGDSEELRELGLPGGLRKISRGKTSPPSTAGSIRLESK